MQIYRGREIKYASSYMVDRSCGMVDMLDSMYVCMYGHYYATATVTATATVPYFLGG